MAKTSFTDHNHKLQHCANNTNVKNLKLLIKSQDKVGSDSVLSKVQATRYNFAIYIMKDVS